MRHRCLDNPLRGLCVFSALDTLSGLILSLLDVESALISSFLDVHCMHFTLAVHHVTMLQVAIRIWWPFQKGKLVRLLKLLGFDENQIYMQILRFLLVRNSDTVINLEKLVSLLILQVVQWKVLIPQQGFSYVQTCRYRDTYLSKLMKLRSKTPFASYEFICTS